MSFKVLPRGRHLALKAVEEDSDEEIVEQTTREEVF